MAHVPRVAAGEPELRRRLARMPWGDAEPTVEAYSVALTALRLAKRKTE